MSEILERAATALDEKLGGARFAGRVKFVILGEGALLVENGETRIEDGDAEVSISAEPDVFRGLMSGTVDPTSAYMTGKLKVDGDLGLALQVASELA